MKYVNILAGIRFYGFMILVAMFVLAVIGVTIAMIRSVVSNRRKINLLKSYGCSRYMSGVPAFGDGEFYSWRTEDYRINIDERDVATMSYKNLERYLSNKVNIS